VRTNFVLIDSENVKPEYIEKLKHEHFRVVVFVGASLKRLDYHIAYYIGKLSASHPDAHFHIISKAKGFDPLIKHLNEQRSLR
jgi:PIN domain-containing protein